MEKEPHIMRQRILYAPWIVLLRNPFVSMILNESIDGKIFIYCDVDDTSQMNCVIFSAVFVTEELFPYESK